MPVDHPDLNRREAEVLQALRALTDHAREEAPSAPWPLFFDQAAVELLAGPAAGSLDALQRYGLALVQPGVRSRLAFAITLDGYAEAGKARKAGAMISVPRSIGGQG